MSNFVSVSDVITFDPEVSIHGWDVRKSAIGITWYHHKGSKIKTFEKPKPPIPVTQPQVFNSNSNLPDGWEEIRDPDGRLFYYHRATKVSKWTRPQGNQLPAGWIECTNPDGRTYYLNTSTQSTSWDRPVGSSPLASDDQKSISSAKSVFLETAEWSPTDKRQSISSQGPSTATPQSPASVRSSTILETVPWSPSDIEKTTVPAHRATSVPNTFVETSNWSPSDPQHRPIPTRADTQPQPGEWQYDQYGHRRHSHTFSKDSLASGSAAATKAVMKSTKTAANATAKGMKVAAKKLKNNRNAQRIVAGVGMAAVNAVMVNQFGISIPTSVGTAAVGLVNVIDFDETTVVVDVTDTDTTGGTGAGDDVNVSGDVNQASMPDGTAYNVDVNQINTTGGNDYVVGGETEVVETTTIVQEEIVIVPGGPTPMAQQPQQVRPVSTYGGSPYANTSVQQNTRPGPIPGSAEWEFSTMQRPAAMFGSHIPIHIPQQGNQRVAQPVASTAAPAVGVQSQRAGPHLGAGQYSQQAGQGKFGNVAQSHIPMQNVQHAAPYQNQNPQQRPNQAHNPGQSQASNQPPPHQQQGSQGQVLNKQHGPQPQRPNQPQLNQQQNPPRPQGPQFQNQGRPQGAQSQHSAQQPGRVPVQRPPVTNSNPSKSRLKPQQKAALMNAGMKIGTSLLKSAIRSSMSGNSGGDNYDFDDNDNSFDFGDNSNFDVNNSDFSNDGGNMFDSNDNFNGVTANYDTQDQDQDQFVDTNQQFDNVFTGDSYDTGTGNDMNDYGSTDQFVDSGNSADNADDGNAYIDGTIDQQGTDTTLSVDAGFTVAPDAAYDQQSDINQQGQGILQASMEDDNTAMDGVFTTPDANNDDPSDMNMQGQGMLQGSTEDDSAAMNGSLSAQDTTFSQDTVLDPNAGADNDTASANNLWTVDIPDSSSSPTTGVSQAYAGLTSASLSGPMTDYYDSFASFGGEIPLDQDEDEDQDPSMPVELSSGPGNDGSFQDPTLASADQDISGSLNQDTNSIISPDSSLDPDPQSMDESLDQFQDTTQDPTTEANNFGSTTPTNNGNTGGVSSGQTSTSAAISQLYDGSAYDDTGSTDNSQMDGLPVNPTTGIAQMAPLTLPVMPTMPTPDAMPDPALLHVG